MCCIMLLGMTTAFSFAAETGGEETQEAVTVDWEKSYNYYDKENYSFVYEVYFNINDTAESDVDVNITDTIAPYFPSIVMPGARIYVNAHITNTTQNTFTYEKGGLQIDSGKELESANTGFYGYDGKEIDLTQVGGISYSNKYLKTLLCSADGNPDINKIKNIYSTLSDMGFSGENAISDYLLDCYQKELNDSSLTWDSMYEKYPNKLIKEISQLGASGWISSDLQDELKGTAFQQYIHFDPKDPTSMQIKWPEETLATLTYNLFYKDLFAVTFGDEAANVNPNSGNAFTKTRGIADYCDKDDIAYKTADNYLSSLGKNGDGKINSGETIDVSMALTLDGPDMNNQYQDYVFTNNLALSLNFIQEKTDITVTKVWDDADNKDGIRPASVDVQLFANGEETEYIMTLDESNDWTGTFNVPKYKLGKEVTYTVREVKVEGYTSKITGDMHKGFTITNTHTPAAAPTNPTTPVGTTGSGTGQTGDNTNIMALYALVILSGLVLAGTIIYKRRKEFTE